MRVSCVAAALAVLSACSGDHPLKGTGPIPIDCIAVGGRVSPASARLHPGDTLRASASLPPCPPEGVTTFIWRSSDTTIAVVDSIGGLIRALSRGNATIIAEAAENRSVVGAMALQVVPQ